MQALLLATLLLPASSAFAQGPDEPPPVLDFQEALEMALEQNLSLQQSASHDHTEVRHSTGKCKSLEAGAA